MQRGRSVTGRENGESFWFAVVFIQLYWVTIQCGRGPEERVGEHISNYDKKYRIVFKLGSSMKLQLTAGCNSDFSGGLARLRTNTFNLFDDVQAIDDTAENDVLAVQP